MQFNIYYKQFSFLSKTFFLFSFSNLQLASELDKKNQIVENFTGTWYLFAVFSCYCWLYKYTNFYLNY